MKHTAKALLAELTATNAILKEKLIVNKYDRKYQVKKREPLGIELFTEKDISIVQQNFIRRGKLVLMIFR